MDVIKIIGTPLYQWELGRKISISTPEHTIINRVEFSHTGDTESLVVKPRVEDGQMVADIPNIMLQSGHYINVYLSYSDENLLETATYNILSVMKRLKPSDYVYTETEVLNYTSLEARVAKLEKGGVPGGGEIDPEAIKEAIDEYLEENPLDSKPIKGVDYFTPEEVQEIAEQAAQMVEVPEGGGDKWELINQFSLTETAMSVAINKDLDGNAFRLKKMSLHMYLPQIVGANGNTLTSTYANFQINGIDIKWIGPTTVWTSGHIRFIIEAVGDYIYVSCNKGQANDRNVMAGVGNYLFKKSGTNGEIRSFVWSIFDPNENKPSAMAGATFEAWGVRA